ncbi:MAG: cytochrome-c peroxidase [Geminicoccaceae bacterium]
MKAILLSAVLAASIAPAIQAAPLPRPIDDNDFRPVAGPGEDEDAKVELGRVLFFDRILSGNKNISCATCHHPLTGTGDALSLPIGEGGSGLGSARNTGAGKHAVKERVPRNSPALFNLGAKEFRAMFHDGRVQPCSGMPSGFCSPAGIDLPSGLENPLAVQAMFPVTSGTEMAGQAGENNIADAAADEDLPALWDLLAARLRNIPEYCGLFADAYGLRCKDITFVDAANAIAAFEIKVWRADDSPFDRYVRKDRAALGGQGSDTVKGMELFYGKARCARCHRGKFQTDQRFHAIAMPQIGPGKGDGLSGHEDFGRERVTGLERHRYKFRTPTLRNVELTAPYGHAGAFATLEAMIRHHTDPEYELYDYDQYQAVLPSRPDLDAVDFSLFDEVDQPTLHAIADAADLNALSINLTDAEITQLVAFLKALTGEKSRDLRSEIPARVPSGLPVNEAGTTN